MNIEDTTPVVDEIGKINFSGNIIPSSWFQSIKSDAGRPDTTAILILSEIIYWYRPAEVRDEESGRVLGLKKKFSSDMLQRSYESFCEQFGIKKETAKLAIKNLVGMGLVRIEWRTITSRTGIRLSNVLFLEPVPNKVSSITFKVTPLPDSAHTPSPIKTPPGGGENDPQVGGKNTQTYTETSTETSTESSTERESKGKPYGKKKKASTEEKKLDKLIDMNMGLVEWMKKVANSEFHKHWCFDGPKTGKGSKNQSPTDGMVEELYEKESLVGKRTIRKFWIHFLTDPKFSERMGKYPFSKFLNEYFDKAVSRNHDEMKAAGLLEPEPFDLAIKEAQEEIERDRRAGMTYMDEKQPPLSWDNLRKGELS